MGVVLKPLFGRISVLLAEASPMVGELMAEAMKRCRYHFNVVASTHSSSEAMRKLEEMEPQVAVISTELQDGPLAGFKVLHQVQALRLKTATIMLMHSGERDLVVDAFRGGARGVFYRGHSFKALSKCIRTVHDGQVWASNGDVEFMLEALMYFRPLKLSKAGGMHLLTHREQEVVRLVAEGMRNRDIARKLNLAEHTVRNYVFRVFEKLGVSSRVELVLYALTRPDSDQLHRI